jgi:DNA-binding CsgD family transcriptional regulator/tetratricopeptide (TPR) repeat protein
MGETRHAVPLTAAPGGTRTIVERGEELDAIAGLVDAVQAGNGGVLVVEGVAGIGKTRLLQSAAERATAGDVALLSGRGSQLEAGLPFGVARQLFEPTIRAADPARREALLADGAGPARRLLTDPSPATGSEGSDEFPVIHGLYWLLANLGDDWPHLVVVDDAHWADDASQRFLAFVAARLAGLAVGVIAAVRTGDSPLGAPLLAVEREPETATLRLRTLSRRGVADLVRESLGTAADPAFVDACVAATGGIPFYVRELLVELGRTGVEPIAANAAQIAEVRPDAVARAVVARLADLPAEAMAAAQGLAVLEDANSESLLAGLIGLDGDATRQAVAALRTAGVSAPDRLAFAHPIMGAAVHQDISAAVRAELHARAAQLVREATGDAERIAAHLRHAPPGTGGWAVDALREAARLAGDRGGAAEAVALLRRADAEPTDPATRARVLFELGTAEWRAGLPESVEHLQAAVDRSAGTSWRGEAVVALSRALLTNGRLDDAAQLVEDALARADMTPELRLRLRVELFLAGRPTYAWHARVTDLIGELERHLVDDDGRAARVLLGDRAMHSAQANEPASVVTEQARRAWGAGDLPAVEPVGSLHYWPLIHSLICAGDVDTAERALQTLLSEARRQGSACGYAMARLLRTILDLRRGALLEAEADALEALALTGDHFVLGLPLAVGVAAEALVERGDVGRADEIVAAHPIPAALVGPGFHDYYLAGRGLLHMAHRRWVEARDDLLQAGASLLRWSTPGPSVLAWRSRAALALVETGELDQADELAREEVELAEAFGSPHTLGVALRAAGVVAGRSGDPATGTARLERAVAVLDGTPFALEAARALTDLGTLLHQEGQTAPGRDHLRRGMDLAVHCGAVPLADQARRQLVASGARPRRPVITGVEALTATERRICQLAAKGLTNRHIAQELFVTIKTVEAHLTTSYRKLGITSRNQLTTHLDPPAPETD